MDSTRTSLRELTVLRDEIINLFHQSKDNLLLSERIKTLRKRFTIECEDRLKQSNIRSKVIDLVWEVGWYYPIDIFCKAYKRPDSSVLKPFLDSGMVYFETLKPSYPDVAYKISIFLGDLHRYAFKLCKSESIDSAIRCYLASLDENPSNSAAYLKLSIVYKEKDPELCILYYLRYCLLRRPTDLAANFPLKSNDINTTFSALAFCMIRNVGDEKQLILNAEKYLNNHSKNNIAKFLTDNYRLLVLSSFVYCLKDKRKVELFTGLWCRIFCSLLKISIDHIAEKVGKKPSFAFKESLPTAFSFCGIPQSESHGVSLLQESSLLIIVLNQWIVEMSSYFHNRSLSVGLRMVIHSVLNAYVIMLTLLRCYIEPMFTEVEEEMSYKWAMQGFYALHVGDSEDLTLINVMISSLKHYLQMESFPVDLGTEFTFQFPKINGSHHNESKERSNRLLLFKPKSVVALFSTDSFINLWGRVLSFLKTANLICLLDAPSIRFIREKDNFRLSRIDRLILEELISSKKILIMNCEKTNPLATAIQMTRDLTEGEMNTAIVILDPAEMIEEGGRVAGISILSIQEFQKQLTFVEGNKDADSGMEL